MGRDLTLRSAERFRGCARPRTRRGVHVRHRVHVTAVRERAWLARYVAEPDQMLAEGDPLALALFAKYKTVRMPNLGLNREEVDALLSHLEQRSRAALEQAHKR